MLENTATICEQKVFQEIHEKHSLPLRNFLYYKFGDLEKAADFAQDAFIRLWENCKKVTFDKAKSYLFTVANRLFLDDVDHQKVILKFQKRNTGKEEVLAHNPEYLYRQEEFKTSLEAAVSSLPEKQRTTFLMSRIDKYSNKEIADVMGVSVKAVEKNITSALKNLKLQLDELKNLRL